MATNWQSCIDAIREKYSRGETTLTEISEYMYDQMLVAVPPARQNEYGYVCGEPYCHEMDGTVYYCGFILDGGRYGMALLTLEEFDAKVKNFRAVCPG